MSEMEMMEVIKYLEERSENLRRYSRKLREAIGVIEKQFGKRNRCRICGLETKVDGEKRLVYANAVIPRLDDLRKYQLLNEFVEHDILFSKYLDVLEDKYREKPHKFIPCIDVGIDLDDEEPFHVDENEGKRYFLAFRGGELMCMILDECYECEEYWKLSELRKNALKDLVKSGRLVKFLQYVAERLKEAEQDFREVSEIAEKMASALEG